MAQEMRNKKLLIVDDDLMMLEILKELLAETGAEIDTGENGQEGLDKCSTKKYDLIISDIQMPKLNGVEFLKKIRAIDFSKPKFILVTGFSSYNRDDVVKLGANTLIHKPFEFEEFMKEVKFILNQSTIGGASGSC